MAEEKKMTSAENGSVYEEGALKIQKLTRLAGFPVITFWLIVSGITTLFSMYYVAESALRTRRMMQLPGLAERYVGPIGKILIFVAVTLNSFSCLIAHFK